MVDLKSPLRELALFAGAGGGILGGKLLGWQTVCAVEWEPYAACVLAARQNDGLLPPFPIWDDIQTFDGRPWRGIVDVVSGGFPCQDISAAGTGKGLAGERSGMWHHMARIIGEVRPKFVFVENSPMLTSRGLDRVLGDLAEMGFDARWGVLGADAAGFSHHRARIWLVANSNRNRLDGGNIGNQEGHREAETRCFAALHQDEVRCYLSKPELLGVPHGMAARVDRAKAIGNGQVPRVAAAAWRELSELL